MTSIRDKRQIIQNYVDKLEDVSPLLFVPLSSKGKKTVDIPECKDLEETIFQIINMSQSYYSYNPSAKAFETSAGRLRSAIDIWRHAKSVKPDISIFTVMEVIYSIRGRLYGHYCCTVHRTVFKPSFGYNGDVTDDRTLFCGEFDDILFSEWSKLHSNREPRKVVKNGSKNK
jgi:hypothetical protein